PRDPADGCVSRVWPHQFPRVNNVFELVKAAGGRTAWSDKHPSYEFLNGPSGTGVDDLYTPEITLNPPAVTTTNSFSLTMAYDDMKVAAIVNEINGLDHTGTTWVGTPALFGMNFQAVSVGQKLIEKLPTGEVLVGGYVDTSGTPTASPRASPRFSRVTLWRRSFPIRSPTRARPISSWCRSLGRCIRPARRKSRITAASATPMCTWRCLCPKRRFSTGPSTIQWRRA